MVIFHSYVKLPEGIQIPMDCNHVFLRKRTVIGVAKKEQDIPRPAVSQMHPRADLGS